jgi:hypothetical protein
MTHTPTEDQLRNRFRHPHTPVKIEPVQVNVIGDTTQVQCGDFFFRIQNHPYAARLGALESKRLTNFLVGEATKIANFLERMKREVEP